MCWGGLGWTASGVWLMKKLKTRGFNGLMEEGCAFSEKSHLDAYTVIANKFNLIKMAQVINLELSSIDSNMSDQQTTDRCSSPTIQELLSENKMKDLALSKASNLIQLLNIELQVEKNSHEQNLRLLQEQLRQSYDKHIRELEQQVQLLERQIKKKAYLAHHEKPNVSTVPRSRGLVRASSTHSLENKKRASVNKKYTQTLSNEQAERVYVQVSHSLYRQHLLQLEEWKAATVEQLDELIKIEYDSLEGLIGCIQGISEEYNSIAKYKPSPPLSKEGELWKIIRSQNTIINSMKAYCQQLQDQIKSALFRLNSQAGQRVEQAARFDASGVLEEVMRRVCGKREQWRVSSCALEDENAELKSILDNMIRLVRQQKNIR